MEAKVQPITGQAIADIHLAIAIAPGPSALRLYGRRHIDLQHFAGALCRPGTGPLSV